jgi:hypothetical protein
MPKHGTVSIDVTKREVREVAEWLRTAKPNKRTLKTLFTDEASELLHRYAIEDQFDKAARRKRSGQRFNFVLTREHARLLIRWASRPSPLWLGGPFLQRIDPRTPIAVQRVCRRCIEALNKRRGNPKKRHLTRAKMYARIEAWPNEFTDDGGLHDDRWIRRLKARIARMNENRRQGKRTFLD